MPNQAPQASSGGFVNLETVLQQLLEVKNNPGMHDAEIKASQGNGTKKFEITITDKPMVNRANQAEQQQQAQPEAPAPAAASSKSKWVRKGMWEKTSAAESKSEVLSKFSDDFLSSMGLKP